MIPIVRRTVTVTTQHTFTAPFRCAACGHTAQAEVRVEGVGRSSALYVRADADAARSRAQGDARTKVERALANTPCPRCGAPPAGFDDAVAAWETRAAKSRGRRPVVALVLLGLTAAFSVACAGLTVGVNGRLPDHGASGAVCLGCTFAGLGGLLTTIVWALSGPGKRPVAPTRAPPNVRFLP